MENQEKTMCSNCGEEVKTVGKASKKDILRFSFKYTGRPLCYECLKKIRQRLDSPRGKDCMLTESDENNIFKGLKVTGYRMIHLPYLGQVNRGKIEKLFKHKEEVNVLLKIAK